MVYWHKSKNIFKLIAYNERHVHTNIVHPNGIQSRQRHTTSTNVFFMSTKNFIKFCAQTMKCRKQSYHYNWKSPVMSKCGQLYGARFSWSRANDNFNTRINTLKIILLESEESSGMSMQIRSVVMNSRAMDDGKRFLPIKRCVFFFFELIRIFVYCLRFFSRLIWLWV